MSDDEEDIPLDLTQRIEVDRAPTGGILAEVVGKDRVFVCRSGSRLKAYSAQCPHLGGPLDKGIVTAGTIRCPWHHACFDLATGEATAAPAFDVLPEYPVAFDNNFFSVEAPSGETPRPMRQRDPSVGTMAIVGGGAAGFAAANALRSHGWQGEITLFSEEREQPYDRTLLTKDYLEGAFGDDRLPIARHSLADLGVDFQAESVLHIEPENKRLRLANGTSYPMRSCSSRPAPRPIARCSGRRPPARDGVAVPSGLPTHSRQGERRRSRCCRGWKFHRDGGGGILVRARPFRRCHRTGRPSA